MDPSIGLACRACLPACLPACLRRAGVHTYIPLTHTGTLTQTQAPPHTVALHTTEGLDGIVADGGHGVERLGVVGLVGEVAHQGVLAYGR